MRGEAALITWPKLEEQNTEERDQGKTDGETRINGGHDDFFLANQLFKRFNNKHPAPRALTVSRVIFRIKERLHWR